MTARRLRDLRRLLEAEAEAYSAAVRIEHTGSTHVKAVFNVAGRQTFIITGLTPSDWRHGRKVRADARRALRNLTT
jgi:hypothetical protein